MGRRAVRDWIWHICSRTREIRPSRSQKDSAFVFYKPLSRDHYTSLSASPNLHPTSLPFSSYYPSPSTRQSQPSRLFIPILRRDVVRERLGLLAEVVVSVAGGVVWSYHQPVLLMIWFCGLKREAGRKELTLIMPVMAVSVRVLGRADVLHFVDAAAFGAALDGAVAGELGFC